MARVIYGDLVDPGNPDSDEMVWVESITAEPVVIHRITVRKLAGHDNWYTVCSKPISFRMKSPFLPLKYADMFADSCKDCVKDGS